MSNKIVKEVLFCTGISALWNFAYIRPSRSSNHQLPATQWNRNRIIGCERTTRDHNQKTQPLIVCTVYLDFNCILLYYLFITKPYKSPPAFSREITNNELINDEIDKLDQINSKKSCSRSTADHNTPHHKRRYI